MSARFYCRALSPSLKKMCSPPKVAAYHTTAITQAESPNKTSSPKGKSKPAKSKPSTESVSTGNDYASGKAFFGHDGFSFYDFEVEMEKDRIVQPSSEKAKPSFSS